MHWDKYSKKEGNRCPHEQDICIKDKVTNTRIADEELDVGHGKRKSIVTATIRKYTSGHPKDKAGETKTRGARKLSRKLVHQ